jgi:type I restriction enzyme S subunit
MTLELDKSTWKRVTFGDVAQASKEKCDPNDGLVDRYVAGEHMDTDDLTIHRWGQVGDGYLGPAFHRRFHPGQVLYGSRRTYLRKVAVADFDGVCANTTFVVEPMSRDVLLPEFLPLVMTSEPFHKFAIAESKGSVNPYVNWSDIARYEFDLPPLDVQTRIADLLWAAERERLAARLLFENVDTAVRAWSDTIFGRGAGTERPVGEMLDVCQYGLSTAAGATGDYPMLRMTNLLNGFVTAQDLKYCDLSARDFEAYRVVDGDVLFNRTNSVELVGRSGIFRLSGDFVFASYLIRLRPRSVELLPEYLNEFINSPTGQSRIRVHLSKGVSQANISAANLKRVMIPVPSLDKQRQAIERLNRLQTRRSAVSQRIASATALANEIRRDVFGGA